MFPLFSTHIRAEQAYIITYKCLLKQNKSLDEFIDIALRSIDGPMHCVVTINCSAKAGAKACVFLIFFLKVENLT